jgi:hypothetical protein
LAVLEKDKMIQAILEKDKIIQAIFNSKSYILGFLLIASFPNKFLEKNNS